MYNNKEMVSELEMKIKTLENLNNDKIKFINYLLEKNNIECPICYDQINFDNLYNPGCHIDHIHCLRCKNLITKCSLCKKPINNNTNEIKPLSNVSHVLIELQQQFTNNLQNQESGFMQLSTLLLSDYEDEDEDDNDESDN